MSGMRTILYPGSFDPVTNGHINLIHRGLAVFDKMIVAVAHNPRKTPLFSPDERMQMIRDSIGDEPRVEITTFEGLLVDYAKHRSVNAVMRGLRALSDFEFDPDDYNPADVAPDTRVGDDPDVINLWAPSFAPDGKPNLGFMLAGFPPGTSLQSHADALLGLTRDVTGLATQ